MDQREVFKNYYLFTGVSSNDLAALEAITERRSYTAGEFIFSAGAAPMRYSSSKRGQLKLC